MSVRYKIWNATRNEYDWHSNTEFVSLSVAQTIARIWSRVEPYHVYEVREIVQFDEKIITGIPLDPSLPILMAGHLQDRARKRAKKE
jgi:hypothetical protein